MKAPSPRLRPCARCRAHLKVEDDGSCPFCGEEARESARSLGSGSRPGLRLKWTTVGAGSVLLGCVGIIPQPQPVYGAPAPVMMDIEQDSDGHEGDARWSLEGVDTTGPESTP